MLMRVVMKKFLSAILILLSTAMLMADTPALTLSEGNIDDVELFAPDGSPLDVLSDITESGFIIRTAGGTEAFSSPFGDIYLSGDSVLAVTGYTTDDPTLYLVYGKANVVLKENLPLSFYTPTTRTLISGEGEYAFISTDAEEAFMNFSSTPAEAYDAMRARRIEVLPLHELDYASGKTAATTQSSYYSVSVLCDLLIYDTPEEPVITGEPEITLTTPEETVPEKPVITDETAAVVPEEPAVTSEAELAVPEAPMFLEPLAIIQEESLVPSEPEVTVEAEPAIPEPPVFTGTLAECDEDMEAPSGPVFVEPVVSVEGVVPAAPEFTGTESAVSGSPVPSAPRFIGSSWELSAPVLLPPVSTLIPDAAEETADEEPLISFGAEFGMSYPLNWNGTAVDGEPLILAAPFVNIGRGNWQIGLRVPLQMAFIDEFRLAGFSGREDWDFGTEKGLTKSSAIYHAITDSMALIDHLYLGDPASTIAYLRMERGYERNSTIFSSYGWDEGLAVRLGFNFSNLAFQLYLDNAESPHVGEMKLAFYPVSFNGTSFSINVPSEFLFTSTEDY